MEMSIQGIDSNNLIQNFMTNMLSGVRSITPPYIAPYDLVDSKDYITLYIDLPGLSKKDIVINIKHNILELKCVRTKNYLGTVHEEVKCGDISRRIVLPISIVDKNSINTEYKNGVLIININKINEDKFNFEIKLD